MLAGALAAGLVLLAYGLLKPARDAVFAAEGTGRELLWTGTFVGAVLLQPLWSALADRLTARALLAWALRGAALGALVGGVLLGLGEEQGPVGTHALREVPGSWWEGRWSQEDTGWALTSGLQVWAERLFYVGLSIGNLLLVSVVWSALARRFERLQARRLFGLIAAGASVGSLLGSSVVALGGGALPTWALALVGSLCLEGALRALHWVGAEGAPPRSGALQGLGLLLRVPRLRGLALYVLLFTLGSTWLYFLTGRLVEEQLSEEPERVAYFARMQAWTSAATLAAQLFLSGRAMRSLGLGPTLAILPLLSMAGLAAVATAPGLTTLLWVNVVMGGARYAFARPGREALLAGAPRAQLFQAKAALDTAVYRGGDLASAWLFAAAAGVASGGALAVAALPALALGAGLGLYLGRAGADDPASRR